MELREDSFYRFSEDGDLIRLKNELILEMPLDILIGGRHLTTVMFTPSMIRETVIGLLFCKGYIQRVTDIERLDIEEDQNLFKAHVSIKNNVRIGKNCNIFRIIEDKCKFSLSIIVKVPHIIKKFQPLYMRTEAAHAGILLDKDGKNIICAEDIGRHNTLDKVIGYCLLNQIPFKDKILVSTGRANLDSVSKAIKAGIAVFVCISRPSAMAVDMARRYNMTLVDVGRGSYRIYSVPERIILD